MNCLEFLCFLKGCLCFLLFIPLSYSNLHRMLIKQRAVKVKRVMTCKWGTLTKRRKKHYLKGFLLFDQDIHITVKWILFEKFFHFCFIILLQRIEKAMGTHFRSRAKIVAEPTSQSTLNLGWGLLSNVLNISAVSCLQKYLAGKEK